MFIVDQFKRSDREIQVISICVSAGIAVLLAGLWYLQIVSGNSFEKSLRNQSIRAVRLPAVRGKILDREGRVLAENRPRYNINLYLEELLPQFYREYTNTVLKKGFLEQHPDWLQRGSAETWSLRGRNWVVGLFGRKPSAPTPRLKANIAIDLKRQASYRVASNITFEVSATLRQPQVPLSPKRFFKHYSDSRYVPFPILTDLTLQQVAIFQEQLASRPSIELETQTVRSYPNGCAAAHVLGYVRPEQIEDEDLPFKYQYNSPDYVGKNGIEGVYDVELRGRGGVKNVLVNSACFRQREEIMNPDPGHNVYLTIDLEIQRATEEALAKAMPAVVRGAAVVLDTRDGDILAMASAPSFDPNEWVDALSNAEWQRLKDEKLTPMFNRATHPYAPGSTFKLITGLACLENGLNPNTRAWCPGEWVSPRGHRIKDHAGEGLFDFEEAFYRSSNFYFISNGLFAGLPRILEMGKRFHLGETTELAIREESGGYFPTPEDLRGIFAEPAAPNVCIGQEITTSPLQMALVTAAIANGGRLFWPRIVSHLKSPEDGTVEELFPPGRIRETIRISQSNLNLLRHAMLLNTEHVKGTGHKSFYSNGQPYLSGFRVGGKTGTAEVKSGGVMWNDTWYVAYGPYQDPRYAVAVMVEWGAYGGDTCGPVARKIFQALIKREQGKPLVPKALAGRLELGRPS